MAANLPNMGVQVTLEQLWKSAEMCAPTPVHTPTHTPVHTPVRKSASPRSRSSGHKCAFILVAGKRKGDPCDKGALYPGPSCKNHKDKMAVQMATGGVVSNGQAPISNGLVHPPLRGNVTVPKMDNVNFTPSTNKKPETNGGFVAPALNLPKSGVQMSIQQHDPGFIPLPAPPPSMSEPSDEENVDS